MTFGRDQHLDELISASLSGDLTPGERVALDAHLAGCDRCRATLEAFSLERNLLSGMVSVAPPRDLAARVRAGVEQTANVPWWRRPSTWVGAVASLATVAAAIVAVAVISNLPPGPVAATGSPVPSASLTASAGPSDAPSKTAEPSAAPSMPAEPLPTIGPDPVGHLEYRVAGQQASMSVTTETGPQPVAPRGYGLPVNAALSPTRDWVAFEILGDGTGLVDTYAYRLADGTLVPLFQQASASPFALLSWSPDGSLLAFTGLSADGQGADAWVFSTRDPESGARQLTSTGRAFAAGFYGCCVDDQAWLWVSTATGGQPSTDRLSVPLDGAIGEPVDPATVTLKHVDGSFLPLQTDFAGTQGGAVAWVGEMALDSGGWHFARGGMPRLYAPSNEGDYDFSPLAGNPIFDTLAIANGGEAFRSARYAWAPDGDGLAVWDAQWQGIQQPAGFPDASRVYFGHPMSGTFIGPQQALDVADTAGGTVVDVALGGGPYLAITLQTDAGSEGGTFGPTAELRIVTRNTGATPDGVSTLAQDRVWFGPAFYHAVVSPD